MQVELVAIQQNLNLDNGTMENFIVVKLPNEKELRLPLAEDDLDAIVALRRGGQPSPPSPRTQSVESLPSSVSYGSEEADEVTEGAGDGVAVFGAPSQEPPPPPVVEQPKQPRRARQVEMNEYGYPRVAAAPGTVDRGEIVGGGDDVDEDGVPSV